MTAHLSTAEASNVWSCITSVSYDVRVRCSNHRVDCTQAGVKSGVCCLCKQYVLLLTPVSFFVTEYSAFLLND